MGNTSFYKRCMPWILFYCAV